MASYPYFERVDPPSPRMNVLIINPNPDENNRRVSCNVLLDTGASDTILPLKVLRQCRIQPHSDKQVRGISGEPIALLKFLVHIEIDGHLHRTMALGWNNEQALIGRDLLNRCTVKFDGPKLKFEFVH